MAQPSETPQRLEGSIGALSDLDPSAMALFLDFDGTLVEIAGTPTGIHVPHELDLRLNRLRERTGGALAIISGRMASDLHRFLSAYDGDFIASHGAEWRLGGEEARHELADSDEVGEIRSRAQDFAKNDPAYIVESKPVGVVLHFRRNPVLGPAAEAFASSLCSEHPRFKVQRAKMAYEIKPADTGKLGSVRRLMERPPYAGRRPVYFGDDDTDEPVMSWADEVGGAGVKVGEGETSARHRVKGVEDVTRLLEHWAEEDA